MQERLESPTASRLWSAASPITSVSRVALLSVHTCPLDQPGMGDSGGMNVYVRSVARRLAEMGVAVDIFTRWSGKGELVREVDPGVRVIHLIAGPDRPAEATGVRVGSGRAQRFHCSLMAFPELRASMRT